MSTSMNLTKGLTALSLSLGLLAGCAAPTSTTPAPSTPTAPTPEAAQPAAPAQPGVAPTMPAPAAAAPMTLTGTATFRGEPLAGYDVTVIDATTGQFVAQTNDLASATGLAVSAQPKTDAKGQFSLRVVGLGAGQALRVQVASGNGRLETIVTANGQSLGAKGYQLAQAGSAFTVTELTTAIAQVAGNVIRTTQVLTPEAAAPLLAKLATEMAGLTERLESKLKAEPSLASGLVSTEGTRGAEAVKTLVTNAGELAGLTRLVASLVADVSKAAATGASPAAADANVKAALAKIAFTGTVLTGALDAKGGFRLSNGINGKAVDAGSGDLTTVTTQITPSGGSGGSAAPTVQDVANLEELKTALAGTASHIRLTGNIGQELVNYRIQKLESLSISRAVEIDGNAKSIHVPIQVQSGGVTLKNASMWSSLTIGTVSNEYRVLVAAALTGDVTLDAIDFKQVQSNAVACQAPVNLTVKSCTFASTSSTALQYTASGGSLAVKGSHFNGVATLTPTFTWMPPTPPNFISISIPGAPSVSWSGTGVSVNNSSTSLTVDGESTFTKLNTAISTSGGTTSISGSTFAGCRYAWAAQSSINALGTAFRGNTLTQLDSADYPGATNLGSVWAVFAYNDIPNAHATIAANNTIPAAWTSSFTWDD